jgi:hypothetical protein
MNDIARGQLQVRDGQHQVAVMTLTRGLETIQSANRPEYYSGCESLGEALAHLGRHQDAIAALETCSSNNAKTIDAWAPLGSFRQSLSLRLADFYRQSARTAEARAVEARVAMELAVADPDLPLVQELRNRR